MRYNSNRCRRLQIMEDKAFNNGDNSDDSKDGNVSTHWCRKKFQSKKSMFY